MSNRARTTGLEHQVQDYCAWYCGFSEPCHPTGACPTILWENWAFFRKLIWGLNPFQYCSTRWHVTILSRVIVGMSLYIFIEMPTLIIQEYATINP
jgi:hypothetical protein